MGGALQCGPGGQNFGWVGHDAFSPNNNWPVCSEEEGKGRGGEKVKGREGERK